MRSAEELGAFHPLPVLLALFEIAKKKDFVERLAKSWAINVVREIRKQNSISTPLNALRMIEAGFPRQHQGNVGEFKVQQVEDTSVILFDSTYAPCGYIVTFAQQAIANFGAINIDVKHLPGGCREQGNTSCRYQITWEESNLLQAAKQLGQS